MGRRVGTPDRGWCACRATSRRIRYQGATQRPGTSLDPAAPGKSGPKMKASDALRHRVASKLHVAQSIDAIEVNAHTHASEPTHFACSLHP